eukprot:CAMPEP_0204224728 /NCGR_PEP_ID=MMETSP0361-20130328/83671_1 /ASSEMBLY_ACC=CAM_ASM_000343 /TAXON_ID=268821 /ORGANISM="Scrippsiella Hangoei, Strain SHTV-5" /LENGTH=64 /DNA_ID=CAMNT_0051190847 /DNA_START=61 /DNA_END=252 /DNA_ORIENTATION=-
MSGTWRRCSDCAEVVSSPEAHFVAPHCNLQVKLLHVLRYERATDMQRLLQDLSQRAINATPTST